MSRAKLAVVVFSLLCALVTTDTQAAFTLLGSKWEPGPNQASADLFILDEDDEIIGIIPANYGTPGSATWSIMPVGQKDVSGFDPFHGTSVTTSFFALTTSDEAAMVASALALWDQVSGFTSLGQVTDGGVNFGASEASGGHLGDIRIGAIAIDGFYGVLAHAFQPGTEAIFGPGGTIAGDMHFDNDEFWADDPTLTDEDFEIDLFTVILHELGHALGLGHSTDPNSVMFDTYQGARRTLGTDDIEGIQFIYGEPVPEPGSLIL